MNCKQCDKEIEIFTRYDKSKTFCNTACAATFNNKNRIVTQEHKDHTRQGIKKYLDSIGHSPKPKSKNKYKPTGRNKRPQRPCTICGLPTTRQRDLCNKCRTAINRCKLCGRSTSGEYCVPCKNELYKQNIFNSIENGLFSSLETRWPKRYLIEKHGHRCEICKTSEWMGQPIPLILDHINGRALDCRVDNIRLTCPNCDRQLPTFGSKNKNSDRKKRHNKET